MDTRISPPTQAYLFCNRDYPILEPASELLRDLKKHRPLIENISHIQRFELNEAVEKAICDYYNCSYTPQIPYSSSEVMAVEEPVIDLVIKVALKRAKNILVTVPLDRGFDGYAMSQLFASGVYNGGIIEKNVVCRSKANASKWQFNEEKKTMSCSPPKQLPFVI